MRQVGAPAFFVVQVMVLALLVVLVLAIPHEWTPARMLGAALIIISSALLLTARYQLGRSFSVSAQARELVTHGIYSKIRNPIYVFGVFLFAGVCLFFQKPHLLFILAIMIPLQIWRAHREARVLEEKFGEAYRQYRKQTWF
jgi:protein-S-isoprenylcysteine O-methyltransferase Ste14